MAAPAEKTIKDLSGNWAMNKTLSDDSDPALALQGISWFTRKAISVAPIDLVITSYEGPPGPPSTSEEPCLHVDVKQTALKVKTTEEKRSVDGVPREHTDEIFGKVEGVSTLVSLEEIDDEHLKSNWLVEEEGQKFLKSFVKSVNGWTATQIWGFQTVDGKRRYCRNIIVKKGDKDVKFRLVYDFVGA